MIDGEPLNEINTQVSKSFKNTDYSQWERRRKSPTETLSSTKKKSSK
jgi:hypothetical protein